MSRILILELRSFIRTNMFAVNILLTLCVLHKTSAQSVPITINQATIEPSPDLHSIIDASPGSESLKEHLASIVKLDAPLGPTAESLKPISDISNVPDGAPGIQDVPETVLPSDANDNTDLKTDASFYYGYGGYHSPYYQQYGNPYYSYWPYGNHYSRPYYQYNPYGYYRRNDYYPGQYYYNPYRRRFPGLYV